MAKRFETARERLIKAKEDNCSPIALIPEFDSASAWDFYDAGDGATLFMYNDVSRDSFEGYCSALKNAGFSEYSSSDIKNNSFITLVKNDVTVDLWRIDYSKEMRLTVQKGIPVIPKKMPCESYSKVQPAFVSVGGFGEYAGMTFVIRLENGNFIIVDGGDGDKMWQYIYDKMQSLATDRDNIVIESWIFTHSHTDHIAAFTQFAEVADVLGDRVTLKSVIANFAGKEQASVPTQQLHETDEIVRGILKEKFPHVPFYKPHPGNIFNFCGLTAEILGTHESFTTTAEDWPFLYNACNLLVKMTIEGQVIMLEGDNDACNNVILGKTYGDYLKCDILQADHHGNFGGVCEVNELFSPEVIIFCHYAHNSEELFAKEYNQTLFNNPSYKEHIVVDTKVFTMMLPYCLHSVTEEQLEK